MPALKTRFNYLFNSTKGLILVAIAMIGIVTAIWGMLSGPMVEMSVREVVIKLFGMDIVQAEREGRIIILYHSIAMAIVAIETYMVTGLLKMKAFFKTAINAIITVGYILTMIFGMGFAYFGHNWAFHGVYIFGLSLIFFAGVLLCIALYPWNTTSPTMNTPTPKVDLTWSAPRSLPLPSPLYFRLCSALCPVRSSATGLKPSLQKILFVCLKRPRWNIRSSVTCTSCWR